MGVRGWFFKQDRGCCSLTVKSDADWNKYQKLLLDSHILILLGMRSKYTDKVLELWEELGKIDC